MLDHKKACIVALVLTAMVSGVVFSQSTELDNTTGSVERVVVDTGRQILREVQVDTFEDPTEWFVDVPNDKGKITKRRIIGSPAEKPPLIIEDQLIQNQVQLVDAVDDYVLGVKTEFYGRSFTTIDVKFVRSALVPGVVKKLSLWYLGRNKRHELWVVIRDLNGERKRLSLGELTFYGWRKLEVNIPDSIDQTSLAVGNFSGFYLDGFEIDTYFEDTVGSFYAYFDDLRIVRDAIGDLVYAAEDDISDGW